MRDLIPIFGMLTGVGLTAIVFLGPVGRAIGDIARHWLGGGHKQAQLAPEDLDELRDRLDHMQHQLGELSERQDFAERLLGQAREKGLIGPGTER